jgi:lipid-A-disaccharide synthase
MVGDPSADKHVAKLAEKLSAEMPDLHMWGIGGNQMRSQGIELMHDCAKFSVLGLLETVHQIPFFFQIKKEILDKFAESLPDMVLLVDFGGFNLRLAALLRKKFPKLIIYYFISPQVWGSRPWRIKTLAKNVDKMLVIFPFEEALYADHKMPVKFVGHPLTKNLPSFNELPSKEEFCSNLNLNHNAHIVAIFPGSRKREIADILPISLDAIKWLLNLRPDLQFVIAPANKDLEESIKSEIAAKKMNSLLGKSLFICQSGQNYHLLKACDLVWAKSGTTTLEVSLLGKPMLIYYRALWSTYLIFCIFKTVKRVGWPNLLAGFDLIPELIQLDCRAEQLVRYTSDLLDVPELRSEISQTLLSLRQRLGEKDYAFEGAREILEALRAKQDIGI